MIRSIHTPIFLAVALALSAFAHAKSVADGESMDRVNGSIEVPAGVSAGTLETVNGEIEIGRGASARTAETVNGSIEIDSDAQLESAETVNGSIELGENAQISGDVESVNGSLELARGARIGGNAENVNGNISLDAASIGGNIETVNGSIEIGADSRVDGSITVRKPKGWGWGNSKSPRVVIGPNAIVGDLVFEREVELFVHESAKTGNISGATAKTFSGDQP